MTTDALFDQVRDAPDDPERVFLSSDFVRPEVRPKAIIFTIKMKSTLRFTSKTSLPLQIPRRQSHRSTPQRAH
jgi:hypothetical protein